MNILSVILARSGSKGLPGKNRCLLAGKPLVTYPIEHAQRASHIDTIAVSTDDSEISKIATGLGVELIERPAKLATDTARVDQAAGHAVDALEKRMNCQFNTVVILYGNVPIRPHGLIDRAIEKLQTSDADSVQSVCPVGKFHPYWMTVLGGSNADVMAPFAPNNIDRRQDLPPVYQLDGGVIVVRRSQLVNTDQGNPHGFLGSDRRAIVTEPGQVVDVDSANDLLVAQATLNQSDTQCPTTDCSS